MVSLNKEALRKLFGNVHGMVWLCSVPTQQCSYFKFKKQLIST